MRYTWDFLSGVRLRELKNNRNVYIVSPPKYPWPLTGMNKLRVCMGIQTGFCEGGRKSESCPLTDLSRVSVKRASTVSGKRP